MKRLALRLIAIVAGAVLALVLIETVLRVSGFWVGRHTDTMFSLVEHDDVLGWRMKRSLRASVDLVDVEGIPVASNSLGFWDREWTAQPDGDRCRAVFLGDSFTWGMGVRQEERFSDLVATADGWESLNFGVPGFGADQSVLVWETEAQRFGPDVVVLTIYQNDFNDDLHLVRYGRRKPFFVGEDGGLSLRGVPVERITFWEDGIFNQLAEPYASMSGQPPERRSPLAHWLVKNSDTVRAVYTAMRGAPRSGPSAEASTAAQPPATLGALESTQVSLLVSLVMRLRAGVDAAGAHLLVVLAGPPSPQQAAASARLAAAGIAVVDATTDKIAAAMHGEAVYFAYSGHWTAAAHKAAASMIAQAVKREHWCTPSR